MTDILWPGDTGGTSAACELHELLAVKPAISGPPRLARRPAPVALTPHADHAQRKKGGVAMKSLSPRSLPVPVAVLAAGLLFCARISAAGQVDTAAPAPASTAATVPLERAKAAAQEFSSRLRTTLQAAMAKGGPASGVQVCSEAAPAIAEEVASRYGVRLGRVALPGRNRNPAQAAKDWQLEALQQFQKAVSEGAPAADQALVVRERLPEGVALRMIRGIPTESGCLACHGTQVAPQVRAMIASRYPTDGATGFGVGDLRGALWVEVPATQP